MIGRYSDMGRYRQLLQLREFYTLAAGLLFILLALLFKQEFYVSIFAATAAVVMGGPIIYQAGRGIRNKELNVDELVSLAIIASFIIGEYLSAAVVTLIMTLGSLLEQFTAQRARTAINTLIRLTPDKANVIRGGREFSVPLEKIGLGETVLIRSGERVPVDGRILRGHAAINQASLTGEALPVEKKAGDSVFAGTVVYAGMLEVKARKVGKSTTLGKMVKLVQEAESRKAPIIRLANRYARYFTPAILFLSAAVFLWTKDAHRAITVLIVGCPCAFILASPTAIVAAIGNASRNGVLVKGGAILEEASRIKAVLFDKTGTLTTGRPRLTQVRPLNGCTEDYLLSMAASAEKYSCHPLAVAIVSAAQEKNLLLHEPMHYRDLPGLGVEAQVCGKNIFVGRSVERKLSAATANRSERSVCPPLPIRKEEAAVRTVTVYEENIPIGDILLDEEIRSSAAEGIRILRKRGVSKIQMLTGDNSAIAARVAKKTGIVEFFAELLPAQKLALVRQIQRAGCKVAVVGDGVNDAPSLAAADIGIAMGAMGTDAAIDAADIALMGDDITKVPYLLGLGKLTVKTININIFFALTFNALALAASGAGLLNPITGAIAHNIGSIAVIANSAWLLKRHP
ncbi:MAG TPA: cadmium-translocating P-type ATPase [Firmicutes bacterium]|nr:cadmium-translocating P-type ATPase [Bacillota bacterium]